VASSELLPVDGLKRIKANLAGSLAGQSIVKLNISWELTQSLDQEACGAKPK
jgi:hypothetical protein